MQFKKKSRNIENCHEIPELKCLYDLAQTINNMKAKFGGNHWICVSKRYTQTEIFDCMYIYILFFSFISMHAENSNIR